MEIQEIEVTIGKDGKVELVVHGVKGRACLELTRALEETLGGVVISREMTPESLDTPDPNQLSNDDQIDQKSGS